MGIEKDIERLFDSILKKYNGNKAAAAASLNTNPVTFWGWATGKRKPPLALCMAIDNAGGKLFIPGEPTFTSQESSQEIKELHQKIEMLTKENNNLIEKNILLNKLVNKYELEEKTYKR